MKKLKLNNKLTLMLIVIVLSIWAIIIYSIIGYLNSSDNEATSAANIDGGELNKVSNNKYQAVDIDTLSYVALGRNPFILRKRIEEVPSKPKTLVSLPKVKETPPPPRLDYKITGVIISGGSKLAVIEDVTNSRTVFLHEGESYQHLHIQLIETEKVSLLEDNTPKEIVVPR